MSDTYEWATYRDIAKEVRRIADIFNPDHRNFTILDLAARELESIDPYMTEADIEEEARSADEQYQRYLATIPEEERQAYEGRSRGSGRARTKRDDRKDRQSLLDAGECAGGQLVTTVEFKGLNEGLGG